jgi:hypothetical protein
MEPRVSEFIEVLGEDPQYPGRTAFMYIDARLICKIYPVYAEKGADGSHWRCTFDHPNAILFSYVLEDVKGNKYSCGKERELKKLGIVTGTPRAVGFVSSKETNQKVAVDPIVQNEA